MKLFGKQSEENNKQFRKLIDKIELIDLPRDRINISFGKMCDQFNKNKFYLIGKKISTNYWPCNMIRIAGVVKK